MKIKRILCAALLLAATSLVSAANVPRPGGAPMDPSSLTESQIAHTKVPEALYRLAAIYKQKGDYERLVWTLRTLIGLQPNSGDLKLALATTYAVQGEKTKTYDLLLSMQKEGYGYDLSANPNFAKVSDTRVWTYVVDNLKANLKPFGQGKTAFTLPKGDTLFESLVFDPKRKQFLAGSVREGKIYLVDKNGKLQDFIKPDKENGLWSVYAMAADPADDALYVASTASVYFKGFTQADFGSAGVFKFRLSTGKFLEKYVLAADGKPRALSSIAVGPDGLVFAADGLRNVIYRLDSGSLKLLLENPRLTSLRGLALSGDGKKLYFADYALGVFGVDLAAGKAFDLDYDPAKLSIGGIDGLYWYDKNLIVIENGMSPHRIMRLTLADDGRGIVKAMPLDVANPTLTLPTYGAIDGDGLYFIANSQKNAYGIYGTPKDDAKLEAVRVFRSDLRFAWNDGGIDTRRGAASLPGSRAMSPMIPSSGTGMFANVQGGVDVGPSH